MILAVVAVAITVGVYGVVGLIVKMDDVGLHLAERRNRGIAGAGRALVHAMPKVMAALSVIGIAAMIWVGGGIIVHGLEVFGLPASPMSSTTPAWRRAMPSGRGRSDRMGGRRSRLGPIGLALGALIVLVHHKVAAKALTPRSDVAGKALAAEAILRLCESAVRPFGRQGRWRFARRGGLQGWAQESI